MWSYVSDHERGGLRGLLQLIRGHWGAENGLHCGREETLREDSCPLRIRHAARVMATINNLVFGLLLTQRVECASGAASLGRLSQ